MFHKLLKLLCVWRYPRYAGDLFRRYFFSTVLRGRGVIVGEQVVWYGQPILSRIRGSTMKIGSKCRICSRSSDTALGVNHPVIIRTLTPKARITIGDGVRMSGTTVCAASTVEIGSRCVIGANVTIVDTDFHSLDPAMRSSANDATHAMAKAVSIGNDVFLGVNSIILKGVTVGHGAVIGAGSVVSSDVPPFAIFAGNPARQIGSVEKHRQP